MSFVNLLPLLSDTVFITAMYRLFSRGGSCSALGPGHRLNTGSAAADRAALAALLVAFIPFFSRGARFDVFPRRRTGCSAGLLRKGNAAHEERRDRAKRQPQRSTNGHEVFLPFYAPFTNVEAGHWLRLDPDTPFHGGTSRSVFRGTNRQYMLVKQVLTARPVYLDLYTIARPEGLPDRFVPES